MWEIYALHNVVFHIAVYWLCKPLTSCILNVQTHLKATLQLRTLVGVCVGGGGGGGCEKMRQIRESLVQMHYLLDTVVGGVLGDCSVCAWVAATHTYIHICK